MENVGTWNSDIVIMAVLCFFSPIFFSGLIKLFVTIYCICKTKPELNNSYVEPKTSNSLDDYFVVHRDEIDPEPVSNISKEDQWNAIVSSTIEQAMNGDKSARDWITKHVFMEDKSQKPKNKNNDSTQSKIMKEAYNCLMPLGYKPAILKDKVKKLCGIKTYTDVNDLIEDVIRG